MSIGAFYKLNASNPALTIVVGGWKRRISRRIFRICERLFVEKNGGYKEMVLLVIYQVIAAEITYVISHAMMAADSYSVQILDSHETSTIVIRWKSS